MDPHLTEDVMQKLLRASFSLLVVWAFATVAGNGQNLASINIPALPESPGALAQGSETGSARVSGTVVDVHGDPVPGAKVILSARGRFDELTTTAAADGTYTFSGVPAINFRVSVSAAGFEPLTSAEFLARNGDTVTAPKLALAVATSTDTVNVVATQEQVATEQVREQEHQRVLGVFPNFYTSYIWKAEPMSAKQKYKLAGRSLVDPFALLIVAGIAGAEQYNGTYPGYGPGIEGYGKRFGAAYADSVTGRMVGSAILPSLLHQDPRYFYQGSGGVVSRSRHAVASTFFTRGDNGKTQFNYSHLGGELAAGALANAYHPASSRGLGLTFETFGITAGTNIIGNLIREFIFRSLEPSVPVYANGRKP